MTSPAFAVTYAPELAQYVVERDGMRVVPTARKLIDTDARIRSGALCVALNRVYAPPSLIAVAAHYEDGSPRNLAWGENDARWTDETDAAQDAEADAELLRGPDLALCACGHDARWHIAGRCFADAEMPCQCEEYAP